MKEIDTLNKVVDILYKDTEEYRQKYGVTEHDIDEKLPHHGFGTNVRNELYLWWHESLRDDVFAKDPNADYPKEKPALVKWFNDRNIFHADDMSGIIQAALKAKIANKSFDFDNHIKMYFKHWGECGYKDGIFTFDEKI